MVLSCKPVSYYMYNSATCKKSPSRATLEGRKPQRYHTHLKPPPSPSKSDNLPSPFQKDELLALRLYLVKYLVVSIICHELTTFHMPLAPRTIFLLLSNSARHETNHLLCLRGKRIRRGRKKPNPATVSRFGAV